MKNIKDLKKVSVRFASDKDEHGTFDLFHLEGWFKNGEKYTIAEFDESCEGIADEIADFINGKINKKYE